MRFVLGVLIGFGIGFAGAVLFAPEKAKPTVTGGSLGLQATNGSGGVKSAFDAVRKQLDEARTEARKAQRDAEKELTERYERSVSRPAK
ncbi:MAG: YtxH domain-containing protein [Dehalococcoidia bacterium]